MYYETGKQTDTLLPHSLLSNKNYFSQKMFSGPLLSVSNAFHLSFFKLELKKVASFILLICQNQISTFYTLMNKNVPY